MEQCKIVNLFNLEKTIAKKFLEEHTYPWEILTEIRKYIIILGKTLGKDYIQLKDNVWVHKTAKIAPNATIIGPCIICKDAEIKHCAFIRENVIIGENSIIGNSSEIKNSILFNEVKVPHFNYIGDSILGYKVHLGAHATTSNLKADKNNIIIKNKEKAIDTGLKKVGAMIGDYVEIGCNAVLNPGTVIGKNTNIYPLSFVRGIIPKNKIHKNNGEIITKQTKH